jgi:DNA helicase II / ATP-dependent DNA helicase PcrA
MTVTRDSRLSSSPWSAAGALNPQQLAAVTHGEGPQLVLAGAGSGKTRVITYRIAWLVTEQGIDPSQIAAVTFTNKAAGEMRDRVEALVGGQPQGAFVGTFHRFALTLLRRYGERVGLPRDFAIFDAGDQRSLVRKAIELEGLSDTAFAPRSVLGRISSAKNRMLDPGAYEAQAEDFFSRKVAGIYRRYQGLLLQAAAVDFDDMLFWAVRLLRQEPKLTERWRHRLRYLLVDEFQDTNQVQLELVKELVGPAANLTAVGDEDQGIYRWRGAELDNILDFERHFPGAVVRRLEQNYRSTQTILDAAGAVVQNNRRRRGKRLWTEAGAGETIRLFRARDEGDEAAWIVRTLRQMSDQHPLHETAVLVRTHAQTRALEEELLRHGLAYTLVGGVRFYERAEIKDLIAYLRVLRNPRDTFSLERILNQPPRGIGKGTRDLLGDHAARLGVPLWDALLQEQVLDDFPARASRALRAFREVILELQAAASALPLPQLLERLLERTGYAELFDPEEAEGEARLENIQELLSAAQEVAESHGTEGALEQLTAFLDHASLVTDIDAWSQAGGGVSLMTLHSAKGLEFPVVVVAGLEEGLLPHFNAQGGIEDIEEERRLLYVGMTRAERRLLLTCCRRRRIAGRFQDQEESEFLSEIPEHFLEVEESPRVFAPDERSREVYRFFDRSDREPEEVPREAQQRPDELPSAPPGRLARGARVRHPTLGEGTVMSVEGGEQDRRLTVYFERWGKRKLVARYAKLEVLGR